MRNKTNNSKWVESLAWKAVKGWVVLLLVWLTLPPIASKVSGRGENDLKTVLTGTIRAGQISPITLDFTARTVSVAVKPGDVVEAGQLMAVLESAEVDDRLARARRRLELASARTDVRPNSSSQLLSQEQRRSAEQQRQEAQIRLSAYTTDSVEAGYARAEKEFASMTRLVQHHLATAQDLEIARKQLDMELLNVNNARNTVTRLKHELNNADSQLRMVLLQKDVAEPSQNSSAQLEYEDAKNALESVERQKKALNVVAPAAGTVLTVAVQPGSEAGGWAPLFRIAELSNLMVEVPVTSRVAQLIHIGNAVKVVLPGDPPQEISSHVQDLQLVPDQLQQSHVVRISIPNPSRKFVMIGMECAVEFRHGGTV